MQNRHFAAGPPITRYVKCYIVSYIQAHFAPQISKSLTAPLIPYGGEIYIISLQAYGRIQAFQAGMSANIWPDLCIVLTTSLIIMFFGGGLRP